MGKKYRKITLGMLALLICFGVVAVTYAYYTSQDVVTNQFVLGNVDIEIDEGDYTDPESWNGESYDKIVKILNKSKGDALIRVAIVPSWVDEEGNPWPGDTNIVTLNYVNTITLPGEIKTNKWINGNDGYYYYNTIVPTGEWTVEILKSVSANIPADLKDRYSGKKLIVDVEAEAVQATKDAHRATWSNIVNESELQKMLDSLCAR